jgi:hypothetical protein
VTFELGFTLGLVLELLNGLLAETVVDDENGFTLEHNRDHHNNIFLFLWKFKHFFRGFDIECKHF